MTESNRAPLEPANIGEHEWQHRAMAAEAKAGELEAKLGSIGTALSETQAALASNSRRYEIDLALMHAEALDLEAARLLIESAIAPSAVSDIAQEVASLKRRKPFLFRARPTPVRGMSPSERKDLSGLAAVADHARATGDRRALLRYLRAKRSE